MQSLQKLDQFKSLLLDHMAISDVAPYFHSVQQGLEEAHAEIATKHRGHLQFTNNVCFVSCLVCL
jgi:hypothetical protein